MVVLLFLILGLFMGCAMGEPPAPPVVPAAEDLSTWVVPEVVAEVAEDRATSQLIPQKDPLPTAAEKVYDYAPGGTYTVPVSVGFPLDVVFARSEVVRNVTDGDRTPQPDEKNRRWVVLQGASGVGSQERHHVFVTVTEAGLKNGLTITTTRGAYYVTLESVKQSPIRVLRWKYPHDPVEVAQIEPTPAGPLPLGTVNFHVGYSAASSRAPAPTWMPRQIVDDGKKTYLIYPEVTLFEMVPLVRLIGPNGPQLVNARQYLNVVILDQLIGRAELRVGTGEHAEVVTITRGPLRTIRCPEDAECPKFPSTARVARGQS